MSVGRSRLRPRPDNVSKEIISLSVPHRCLSHSARSGGAPSAASNRSMSLLEKVLKRGMGLHQRLRPMHHH